MKYAKLDPSHNSIIETQHEIYPIGEWGFVLSTETHRQAIELVKTEKVLENCRVVDREGKIIFEYGDD